MRCILCSKSSGEERIVFLKCEKLHCLKKKSCSLKVDENSKGVGLISELYANYDGRERGSKKFTGKLFHGCSA